MHYLCCVYAEPTREVYGKSDLLVDIRRGELDVCLDPAGEFLYGIYAVWGLFPDDVCRANLLAEIGQAGGHIDVVTGGVYRFLVCDSQ